MDILKRELGTHVKESRADGPNKIPVPPHD
jgi:hypothetical protein